MYHGLEYFVGQSLSDKENFSKLKLFKKNNFRFIYRDDLNGLSQTAK